MRDPVTFAPGVARALPVLLAQRLILNTAGRMMFTHLPTIAAGAGLSITGMSRAIFARDMTALLGPFIGRATKAHGAWRTMTVTSALATVGMLLILLGPVGVVVGLVLWGLCRNAFLIASMSWVSNVVAYERRGRAMGLVELTWAAAALVGLPAVGLLIGFFGWWAAPLAMAVIGGPLAAWAARTAAPEGSGPGTIVVRRDRRSFHRTTWVALVGVAMMMSAAQFLFFSHGLWLTDTYGFDAAQVGFAIVVVGLAEATGSLTTARITDLIGKRMAVIVGASVLVAAELALALAPQPPLAAGLFLLVAAFLGSEFSIVSSIALISELQTDDREAVIGTSTALSTAVRASTTLIAGMVYVAAGFATTMAIAVAVGAVAITILVVAVREPAPVSAPGK